MEHRRCPVRGRVESREVQRREQQSRDVDVLLLYCTYVVSCVMYWKVVSNLLRGRDSRFSQVRDADGPGTLPRRRSGGSLVCCTPSRRLLPVA